MNFEEQWGMPLTSAVEELDDQLRVVVDTRVVCCIGLIATFYYDCPVVDARERAISAYERYRLAIGDKLLWGADPKTGRPMKLKGTNIGDPRVWSTRVSQIDEFSFVYHGGRDKRDASAYMIQSLPARFARSELSVLTFALPLAWVAAQPPGEYTRVVLDVARILRPEHGYAGLAAIPHVNQSSQSPDTGVMVGLVRRFRGLEFDFPFSHSIYLHKKPAIKGVNWLTILGDAWVMRVGGEVALRAALSEGVEIHRYGGGVLIQAGPKPLFGDVNRNESMVAYQSVAQALKSIRTTDVNVAAMYGMSGEVEAAWLSRFD